MMAYQPTAIFVLWHAVLHARVSQPITSVAPLRRVLEGQKARKSWGCRSRFQRSVLAHRPCGPGAYVGLDGLDACATTVLAREEFAEERHECLTSGLPRQLPGHNAVIADRTTPNSGGPILVD
jgi:hypothetical protein